MFDRKGKNQRNKRMRFMAGVLAVTLTVTNPFPGVPDVASGAQRETEQKLPTGGVMEVITEPVVRVLSEGSVAGNTIRSIRPELSQYDWDCYSNDYYYSKLSTKERQLYERLDAACGELLTSSGTAAAYEVNSGIINT